MVESLPRERQVPGFAGSIEASTPERHRRFQMLDGFAMEAGMAVQLAPIKFSEPAQ
jgi:hypothetical protein